jgi:shikimate dehydrogenase
MNRYGLIGYPLSHSFSERFFATKFRNEQITDCVYENFPIENIQELYKLISTTPDLKGLNVTIPYKEKVLAFLTTTNDTVRAVGACNCIKLKDGKLVGYNTDVTGFEKSFSKNLLAHHTKALILGEGGAAKAVAHVLERIGIHYIYVVRRGESNSQRILISNVTDSIIQSHTVIINCTPLGMFPAVHEAPLINYDVLTPDHYLYDLIYNPEKTLFLAKGEDKGATVKNGYEMLELQAEESWKIWTNNDY